MSQKKQSEAGWWSDLGRDKQRTRLARNQVTHALVPPFLLPGQADRLPTCRGLGPVSLPAITLRSHSSFLMHSQDRKRFHSRIFFVTVRAHTWPDVRKNAMHQCKQAKVHDRHVPIWSVRVDVGYKPRSFCRRRKVVSLPTFRWRI